jgi:hypothetical protein
MSRSASESPPPITGEQFLIDEWMTAQRQAWDALARYKFWMFGYYAARVVYLGKLLDGLYDRKAANPFRELVAIARQRLAP